MTTAPAQQISLFGAISVGLASILGAGVFVVFSEAYALAGGWLWASLVIAGTVAALNAASIYQLARQHDRPGGVYAYARVYLTAKVANTAGFAFIIGKIASIAAIGLVFGAYVLPGYQQWVAIGLIAVLATVNVLGIQRTAAVATILTSITIAFLVLCIVLGLIFPAEISQSAGGLNPQTQPQILAAAALFFFAFAGYARVATLGAAVRNAKVNVPRAIWVSMVIVFVIYLGLTYVLGPVLANAVDDAQMPFLALFEAQGLPLGWLAILVAAVAAAGSMLALLAGVSRTASEMAADSVLPEELTKRNRFGSPWVAEVIVAAFASVLVLAGPVGWVISLSSLGVLFYYAIGHLSALAQPREARVVPKIFSMIGLLLCLVLASSAGVLFASSL